MRAAVRRCSPPPLGLWHPGADTQQHFFNDEKGFVSSCRTTVVFIFVQRNETVGNGLLEGESQRTTEGNTCLVELAVNLGDGQGKSTSRASEVEVWVEWLKQR